MTTDVRSREREAHRKQVEFAIADIAQFLQETLGQKLVAYIAEVSDPKTVGHWARGDQSPRADSEERLRAAFQIFHLLQSEESAHTVRAWLIGMNPQLDDQSPAEAIDAIREGRLRDAWVAAKAYVAGRVRPQRPSPHAATPTSGQTSPRRHMEIGPAAPILW